MCLAGKGQDKAAEKILINGLAFYKEVLESDVQHYRSNVLYVDDLAQSRLLRASRESLETSARGLGRGPGR